jgi:hypothetical protein
MPGKTFFSVIFKRKILEYRYIYTIHIHIYRIFVKINIYYN